jgi:hypothetical protein
MASPQVETVGTGAEKMKLALAAGLVLAALVAFYLLAKQGQLAMGCFVSLFGGGGRCVFYGRNW